MKTINKNRIKEIHSLANNELKSKIEDYYPFTKKASLEVCKWYKNKYNCLFYIKEIKGGKYIAYGFTKGIWSDYGEFTKETDLSSDVLATEQEVSEALINEAKKIGFKERVKFRIKNNKGDYSEGIFKDFSYYENWLPGIPALGGGKIVIFRGDTGWAEIIKETEVTLTELTEFYKKQKGIDNLKVV